MSADPSNRGARSPRVHHPNPRLDQYRRTWYFLRQNTLAMVGLAIIIGFAILYAYSFFYPVSPTQLVTYQATDGNPVNPHSIYPEICTYEPGEIAPGPNCYQTPSGMPSVIGPTVSLSHPSLGPLPFGSLTLNPAGPLLFNTYDGLVKGAEWSVTISVAVVGLGALLGLIVGVVSGYYGGYIDEVIMRTTDVFLSIPGLLLVIIVLATFAPAITNLWDRVWLLVFAFDVTWWPFYARIVRGQVLVIREQRYVEAAKASGASGGRMLRKHIIPNSMYPVLVQVSLDVGTVPLLIASIVFIGFQVFPTQNFPEWGTITAFSVQGSVIYAFITDCQTSVNCAFPWWQFFFPGFTLFLFAISVNFLSDGLRDALDPRLRR